jgi:hypothetical protein
MSVGVWVRSQLAALDVEPYKRDFRRGLHTGSFLRALRLPPPSKFENSSLVRKLVFRGRIYIERWKKAGRKNVTYE